MKENYVQANDSGLFFTHDFFEFCLRKQFNDPGLTVEEVHYVPSAGEKMALELKHPKKGDHPYRCTTVQSVIGQAKSKRNSFFNCKIKNQ